MRSMLKARALIVCVVAAGLTMVGSADAAAPNYILVSGSGLKKPILLGNWGENHSLDLSFTNGRPAPKNVIVGLAHRSRLDLAEFWGWGPPSPVPKHPREANQHASFYPAHATQPAVVVGVFNGARRLNIVPATALRILARHHVPIRR